MIRGRMNLISCAFLLAATSPVVGTSEPARSAPGSHPAPTVLEQGIISTNDKLTINVEDVEIAQLLRMLSVERRVSIVAGPRVSGRISLNLYDVTFEEALRSILDVSGCTATHRGDVILVTGASEKALLPLDTADLHIRVFELDYVDPNEAFSLVREFVSPAGKAVVSNLESTLLVQDTSAYLERISSLVEQMDVPPKQVLIEATLLDVKYDDNLTVGVEVSAQQVNGDTIYRALTSGFAADPTLLGETARGLFAAVLTEDVSVFLEALAETTNVKTLANPKILAVDGQQAEIIIGERLGFRITTTTETSSLESVEFLEVGTQLKLTPQIGDDGLVLLKIHPEVSTGNINVTGLPSEATAEATTFMLVRDGQTVVLGGLLKETTSESVSKVPLLGDIPVFGHLFRRTTKSNSQSELVVLITPHIVGPEPDQEMKEVIKDVERKACGDEGSPEEECERYSEETQEPPSRQGQSAHVTEPSDLVEPEPADADLACLAPLPAEAPVEQGTEHPTTACAEEPWSPATEVDCESVQKSLSRIGEAVGDYVKTLRQDRQLLAPGPAPSEHADETSNPEFEQADAKPGEAGPSIEEAPANVSLGYSIQVFAARSEEISGDYVKKLQQDGLPAWVSPPKFVAGDKWYRAMVGRFSTRAEANETLKELKQRKELADAFVRGPSAANLREGDAYTMYARANEERGEL